MPCTPCELWPVVCTVKNCALTNGQLPMVLFEPNQPRFFLTQPATLKTLGKRKFSPSGISNDIFVLSSNACLSSAILTRTSLPASSFKGRSRMGRVRRRSLAAGVVWKQRRRRNRDDEGGQKMVQVERRICWRRIRGGLDGTGIFM